MNYLTVRTVLSLSRGFSLELKTHVSVTYEYIKTLKLLLLNYKYLLLKYSTVCMNFDRHVGQGVSMSDYDVAVSIPGTSTILNVD